MRKVASTTTLIKIIAFVWIVLGVVSASADEFKVGILLDSTLSDTTEATFMEGFQLAVDQSPDVSHPAGIEGGDHLGSMDVVMIVVDNVTEPSEFLTIATDLIEREGVPIIVADVSPDVLATLFEPITESETMLIAMSDTGDVEFPATLFFFAVAEQDRAETLLTDRIPVFEDAFVAAYGRLPAAVATRGYLAGRLVDIAVEATDRNPFDEQALNDGLFTAIGSSSVPGEPEPSLGIGGRFIAVIVGVVTIVGWRFYASR